MSNKKTIKDFEKKFASASEDEKVARFFITVRELAAVENSCDVAWAAHNRREEQLVKAEDRINVLEAHLSHALIVIHSLTGYPERLALPCPEVCHG